ncbi:unnamed protein product, partial [Brenthis ino]
MNRSNTRTTGPVGYTAKPLLHYCLERHNGHSRAIIRGVPKAPVSSSPHFIANSIRLLSQLRLHDLGNNVIVILLQKLLIGNCACDVAGGAGSVNALPAGGSSRLAPSFDAATPRNVTALVGKSAYLNCKVRNLGNRTSSTLNTEMDTGFRFENKLLNCIVDTK